MNELVLVVDDEATSLKLIEQILTRANYQVITAANGQEALAALDRRPDLIILDVMMPDITGIEVCQRIRENPATEHTPVIMLSALGQVQDKVNGLQAGADEYLTKPIAPAELVVRVQTLLARTQRLMASQPTKAGTAIGFIGAKGGVGTTTTMINIAAALSQEGLEVIAAEMAPYFGTLGFQLKQKPLSNISALLKLKPDAITANVMRDHLHSYVPRLRLLMGPQNLSDLRAIHPDQATAIVNGLKRLADFCLIDLPSQPSSAIRAIVNSLDILALVLEPDPLCVDMSRHLLDLIRAWRALTVNVGAIIVNRSSIPTAMNLDQVNAELGCPVFGLVPQSAPALQMANETGRPVVLGQPNHSSSLALAELATEIIIHN